ncbi:MAG: 50S ribosomal protein L17, partial [Anaerolineales bacterium]|nr:50S ribosomal protein L17 [Anaerolineales bacterium]
RKLGRTLGQRNSLRRTLICQLLKYERIKTTEAKAKFIRSEVEKLVTIAKRGLKADAEDSPLAKARAVYARRRVKAKINNDALTKKMFDTLAPRYEKRPGGYTRILKLGPRLGDAAEMVLLEFVEE